MSYIYAEVQGFCPERGQAQQTNEKEKGMKLLWRLFGLSVLTLGYCTIKRRFRWLGKSNKTDFSEGHRENQQPPKHPRERWRTFSKTDGDAHCWPWIFSLWCFPFPGFAPWKCALLPFYILELCVLGPSCCHVLRLFKMRITRSQHTPELAVRAGSMLTVRPTSRLSVFNPAINSTLYLQIHCSDRGALEVKPSMVLRWKFRTLA